MLYTWPSFSLLRIVQLHGKLLNFSEGKEYGKKKLKYISTLK